MMKKRILVVMLGMLLGTVMFTGCGNKNEPTNVTENTDLVSTGSVTTEDTKTTEESNVTGTEVAKATPAATPVNTAAPESKATEAPTAAPKDEGSSNKGESVATAKPTVNPTAKPTTKPVATAEPQPTLAPTAEPTAKPQPTADPTPAPTANPQEQCEHDWVMRGVYEQPTCYSQGMASWECTKCGYTAVGGCGYYEEHNFVCIREAKCGSFESRWECSECYKKEDRYDGTCYTNDGDPYCDMCARKLY